MADALPEYSVMEVDGDAQEAAGAEGVASADVYAGAAFDDDDDDDGDDRDNNEGDVIEANNSEEDEGDVIKANNSEDDMEEDGEQEDEDSAMASADAAAIDDGAEATTFATGQAAADEEEGQDEVSGLDADGAATVTCCPSGHKLALLTADKSMTALSCDMCHGALSAGSDFFSCAACDYDLCTKCTGMDRDTDAAPLPRRPSVRRSTKRASNRSARRRRRQSSAGRVHGTSSTRARRGSAEAPAAAAPAAAAAAPPPSGRRWRQLVDGSASRRCEAVRFGAYIYGNGLAHNAIAMTSGLQNANHRAPPPLEAPASTDSSRGGLDGGAPDTVAGYPLRRILRLVEVVYEWVSTHRSGKVDWAAVARAMGRARQGEPPPPRMATEEAHRLWRLVAYKMTNPAAFMEVEVELPQLASDVADGAGKGPAAGEKEGSDAKGPAEDEAAAAAVDEAEAADTPNGATGAARSDGAAGGGDGEAVAIAADEAPMAQAPPLTGEAMGGGEGSESSAVPVGASADDLATMGGAQQQSAAESVPSGTAAASAAAAPPAPSAPADTADTADPANATDALKPAVDPNASAWHLVTEDTLQEGGGEAGLGARAADRTPAAQELLASSILKKDGCGSASGRWRPARARRRGGGRDPRRSALLHAPRAPAAAETSTASR